MSVAFTTVLHNPHHVQIRSHDWTEFVSVKSGGNY